MSNADDLVNSPSAEASVGDPLSACYVAGLEALRRGDLKEASALTTRCDALSGDVVDARCVTLHGLLAFAAGNLEPAVTYLRHAAQLAPDDVAIARRLGEVLVTSGAWSEAATTLERAAVNAPDNVDLQVDLGYAYMMGHDPAKARTVLERAAVLRPEERVILYSLAQVYETLGERELAASILTSLARRVSSIRLLSELALLLLRLKRWDEAEKAFAQLQRLDLEHDLVALHGRIWCQIQQQDWRSAFDVALETTRLDRYFLTTALLAYAKDRLFSQVPNALEQEGELGERVMAELRDHAATHSNEDIFGGFVAEKGEDHG